MLTTSRSKAELAALFEAAGWRARKSAWSDFEVISERGALVIDGTTPVLLHGPVEASAQAVEAVLQVLRRAQIAFKGECHDEDDRMIQAFAGAGTA